MKFTTLYKSYVVIVIKFKKLTSKYFKDKNFL